MLIYAWHFLNQTKHVHIRQTYKYIKQLYFAKAAQSNWTAFISSKEEPSTTLKDSYGTFSFKLVAFLILKNFIMVQVTFLLK